MLKLALHNRAAVQLGKHYVVKGHAANTVGQLRCRDCNMKGRWSEWRFFTKVAKCKRHHGGETMVRVKMRERAATHNRAAGAPRADMSWRFTMTLIDISARCAVVCRPS